MLIPRIEISDFLIKQHDPFDKSPVLIQWIVIFLLDSAIQPMNNRTNIAVLEPITKRKTR